MILSRLVVAVASRHHQQRSVVSAILRDGAFNIRHQHGNNNSAAGLTFVVQQQQQRRTKVIDIRKGIQRDIWNYCVRSGGRTCSSLLFEELDTDFSGTISVSEIQYFIDSIKAEDTIRQDALDLLLKLGEEKSLDETEFRQWLSMAIPKKQQDDDDDSSSSDSDSDNEQASSSSSPKKKKQINSVQSIIWDNYLSGVDPIQNAQDLFNTIDLDDSGKISVKEIVFFLDSIDRKHIDEDEINELLEQGNDDNELSFDEFSIWLAGAVNVDGDIIDEGRDNTDGCTPRQ